MILSFYKTFSINKLSNTLCIRKVDKIQRRIFIKDTFMLGTR